MNESLAAAPPVEAASPVPPKRKSRLDLRRALRRLNPPARLWYYSCKAYRAGLHPIAWLFKAINFFVFHAILCYECEIENDIEMIHFGFGSVIHPNVTIGRGVKMYHHISLAAETYTGSPSRIVIEDDVVLGAYAMVIGNNKGGVRIGKGAVIGAGTVVVRDVPPGATVVAMPSRPVRADSPA